MSLEDWISQEDDNGELLPLCHTTKWEYFQSIIYDKKLSTKFSKFPDPNPKGQKQEDLVYLFYGLPFYIYETGMDDEINSEVTEDLPIGLIFKPSLVSSVNRFYPFDTGAFLSNKYEGALGLDNDISDYKVNVTNGSEIKKLVKRYYRSNEQYCYGNFNDSVNPAHPKEEDLLRFFLNKDKSKIDLRSRAIEVHSLKDIDISSNILAIILPRLRSAQYGYIKENISSLCHYVDIEYYNDLTRYSSGSIRNAVLEATMNYYNKSHSNVFSYSRFEGMK